MGKIRTYCEYKVLDGVIIAEFEEGASIGLEEAKLNVEERKKASDYEKMPLLVDIRLINEFSRSARNYLSSTDGSELLSASALLIESGFTSMMANFFLKVNLKKPLIPVKLFSNKNEALAWLQQYR